MPCSKLWMKFRMCIRVFSLSNTRFILICLLWFGFTNAQSISAIEEIKTQYQNCLDNGNFMLGCSYEYYNKADSLLDMVCHKIEVGLKKDQREQFRKEQTKWLKKRNAYFKKIRKRNLVIDHLATDDQKMMVADEQAEFIFERVEELIKRL